ncbi:alanine--tRNA ligase [Candidatus Jorgensenbacteria bacterium]|nr:alanine--tRNA ligase [Candidatus Jorgensenbacteria bacterium]
MTSEQIRKLFFEFFKERGHAIAPSSPLIPDDPSVLLTTAGMQQFKRYFTGELNPINDFGSQRTTSIQKCFRTSDIEEVGDETHLTFFEMMGNFSFGPVGTDDPKDRGVGGYFKRSAIYWGYEFITGVLGVDPKRITASIFKGDTEVPRDEISYRIWNEELGLPEGRIMESDRKDNFWGPTGNEGPCGPTSEIYVDGVEVWNLVFNEYYQHADKRLEKLESPGVDTGMGFERLVAVMQGARNVFETDLLRPVTDRVYELAPGLSERAARIFTDHVRAAVFLVADWVRPSNKGAGYILRRHIRRMLAYKIKEDVHVDLLPELVEMVGKKYGGIYPGVSRSEEIIAVLEDERSRFEKAVGQGILELESYKEKGKKIDGQIAFHLYETFGLPFELIKELVPKELAKDLSKEEFEGEFVKHQEVSRAGQERKFGGHGLILDTGELKAGNPEELQKVTRLHTATHLLHQALRDVLGMTVGQMGSDITVERTRFDFSFPRKLTPEEVRGVEEIVNKKIKEDLPVSYTEMLKGEAEKTGALHFFKLKYPEKVKVYFVGKSFDAAYSKEFCGGPHVTHTGEIGKFRVAKEEAVAAGVRRIRGVVE